MGSPYFKGPSLAANEKTVTPKGALPPKAPNTSYKLDGNLSGHGRLVHAIARMKAQGNLSDNAIRAQIHTWNPHMSEAEILNTMNAASPVKTTFPKGSGAYAQAQLQAHPTYDVAPGLRTEDLQKLHKASQAPIVQTLGRLTNPLTVPIDLGESLVALEKHPGIRTGVNAGLAAASILPIGKLAKLKRAAEAAKLAPDEAKALEVVKEGTPISERLATAKGKELADLKAAAKHVHDVEIPGKTTTIPGETRTVPPRVKLPEGTLLHGSPEGELKNIDALHHTKAWREGPGFYATTSPEKAAKYAAGKTASAERRGGAGAINVVKLKPDAKVLNMDAQPDSFWRGLASKIIGEPITEERWNEWAKDIRPQDEKGASNGVLNRVRLMHILTGYDEMPKSDAYYAIEEVLHSEGYQATLHHENGVPVYIIKDENVIEHLGSHKAEDLFPQTITTEPKTTVGKSSVVPRIIPTNHKLIEAYQQKEAQDALRGSLKGARSVRGKQEAGYSPERSARAAAANKFLNDTTLPPEERLARAKAELKGELPKIDYKGMKVLDETALKHLQTEILNHPHLMPFQKIRASDALQNAVQGKVPTNSELTLLEHVFGKETANALGGIHNHPYKNLILSTLNIPRSIMASFDLSAPFRQGLVVAPRHPVLFAKNFKPMIKSFGSEKAYQGILADIHSRPTYPMMVEAKLAITELGKAVGPREEQFASDVAEHIPGIGHGIRASGRAYTGYLDKLRADVFDHLVQRAQSQGINVQDQKFLKDLGRLVNDSTGRGDLGKLQGAGKVANAIFFSPRLLASRMNIIFAPLTYARADPFVRREALKSMIGLAGTLSTILGLVSQIPGTKVVTDPRNPDWGKIKLGNTRIDIAGGFQQPLRLFAQLATGVAISSTTGKKLNLTSTGFGQPTRLDLFLRFWEGKESPVASIATDWLRHSNQVGQKFTWNSEAVSHLTPLLVQDSYDLYKSKHGGMNGIEAAFGGYALGSVGFGLQTYGPKKPKASSSSGGSSYFSNSSGGGSGYFSGGGSSSGGYFSG